jgi:hypothetical protein
VGFWDSLKAAFRGQSRTDADSKKDHEPAEKTRDRVVAPSRPQTATEAVLVEFRAQLVAVDRVLTREWPAALRTNDISTVRATVSRTLPILDRMSAFLTAHHKEVIPMFGEAFMVPYDTAITWYRKAGDEWLNGDVDRANRLLDLAQEDWARAEEEMELRKGRLGLK